MTHQRRVVQRVSNDVLLTSLGLSGLIHFWGTAGSGKTLIAVAIASDMSKYSKVEWINADGKKSFVTQLKKNVEVCNGHPENIVITFVQSPKALVDEIHALPDRIDETGLIIIDPITRVLDMAHRDPILWGQEIVEDILPTLAGITQQFNIDIIVTSECRSMSDLKIHAVHHETIAKWADHDLRIERDPTGLFSHILNLTPDKEQEAAIFKISEDGILSLIPRVLPSEATESVS